MNKRNNKSKIKKILFTVIVLTIGVVGFYLIKPYLPHDYGTTTGNFMNGQAMVELDGELYFFASNDGEDGLYKLDNNSKVIKISDQGGIYLNGVGDYLYFIDWYGAVKDSQIVKVKKDGSESQILFEGDVGSYLVVVDQKIYFGYKPEGDDYLKIYSMTTDGKGLRKTNLWQGSSFQLLLTPQMSDKDVDFSETDYTRTNMQIRGKYIYLYQLSEAATHEYDKLYRVKKNGTEAEFLADRVTAFNVAEDNYLYYTQLNEDAGSVTISKMNLETEEHEKLVEIETNGEDILWLDVAADKICITIEKMGDYLLNTDGTGLIKVSDLLEQIGN